jgi:hypothetical protein
MSQDHPAAAFVEKHAWQPKSVEVAGSDHDACFFDWYALDDERLADFNDYFAGDQADKIASGEWLPLAVLGIGGNPESFAEDNHEGFLALVPADGTVVHYQTEVAPVAASIDELDTQLDIELG